MPLTLPEFAKPSSILESIDRASDPGKAAVEMLVPRIGVVVAAAGVPVIAEVRITTFCLRVAS